MMECLIFEVDEEKETERESCSVVLTKVMLCRMCFEVMDITYLRRWMGQIECLVSIFSAEEPFSVAPSEIQT